ncbi:CRISPR-associated endoribonuclease Cas6 [Dehalococcoidia bacterium]|nr:CRISPR-associated endoribonuclease Cas6 [Dehalococcoidia bacterium]
MPLPGKPLIGSGASGGDEQKVRIALQLEPLSGRLKLPLQYNREVQGMIYCNLDDALADWIHDEGLSLGKRSFKLFTFSHLQGRYHITPGTIEFSGAVRVHVGSVHEQILQSLAEHLLRGPAVRLGKEVCEVSSMEVEPLPEMSRPMRVRTLSPITIYSTLSTAEGRKKTYYYSPSERDWETQLLSNLKRKARALGWGEAQLQNLEDGKAHIRPIRISNRDLKIMKYGNTVIKAWSGVYELDLPEPFFLLAYDAGLGSKNSQGFGMVEVVKQRTVARDQ